MEIVARSKGLCGAIQGAKAAPAKNTSVTMAERIVTLERRKE